MSARETPSPAPASAASSKDPIAATSGVLEYLQSVVPASTLRQLYVDEKDTSQRGPFVCRAVLQQLSSVAQQVVVRLSCTGGKFPKAGIHVWINQHDHQHKRKTNRPMHKVLNELKRWAIIEEDCLAEEVTIVKMTDEYFQGVQDCFRHLDVCPWKAINPQDLPPGVKTMTPEDLERYTHQVWDAVLHFLVGSDSSNEPPQAVVNFLLQTGLMQPDPDDTGRDPNLAPLVITEKGYDFMLQDHHQQVWRFVEQYLQMVSGKGDKFVREALLLLICLSLARVGEAYLVGSLPKSARKMLRGLAHHFGLVYLQEIAFPTEEDPKNTVTIFYPTRVATQLIGSTSDDKVKMTPASALWSLSSKALEASLAHPDPSDSSHLAVLVQTNFQVCAYTTSELHVSMLGLFCDVPSIRRLPNVIFLRITRDSVKGAFNLGIQARQILRFLEKHAHPRLRTRSANATTAVGASPIPANVVDQIWLWDRERTRVRMTEVYQYRSTGIVGEFRAVQQYAMDRGALSWSSAATGVIYVDYKHAERVRAYAQQYKAQIHTRHSSD